VTRKTQLESVSSNYSTFQFLYDLRYRASG